MRLLRGYIENFGKICKKEIEFENNLTIFKEENGWGKTTLSVFIKSMLYGFDKSTTEKAERQKYMPWNGGKYGGNIDLEIKGIQYRIERFFGDTPKGDTFTLINLETNKEVNTYTEKIGEEIFKINKESFTKSIFVPQQEIKVQISNDLTTKLTNLDTIQDDMNRYGEAQKRLLKKSEQLKKEIKNKEIEIKETNIKIERCEEAEKNLTMYEKEYKNMQEENERGKEEIEQLEEKIKRANEQRLREEIIKQYEKIKEIEEDRKKSEQEIKEFFQNGIPQKEEIAEVERKVMLVNKAKEEIKEKIIYQFLTEKEIEEKQKIYNEYKQKDNIIQEIEKSKKQKENEKQSLKQNKNYKIILIIISILIILSGIISIFFIKQKIISSIIIVVGILILFIQRKLNSKNKKENKIINEIKRYESQIAEIKEKKEEQKNDLIQYICKYEKKYIDEDIYEILLRIKLNYNNYKNSQVIIEENKLNIEEYLQRYFKIIVEDYGKYLDEIKIKIQDNERIKEEYQKAQYDTHKFLEQHNIKEIEKIQPIEEKIEDIEESIQKIKNKINIVIQNMASTNKKIDEFSTIVDEKPELETDLEEYEEQKTELERRKNILDKTMEILEKAKEKLSANYLQSMNLNLNKYIKILSENSNIADKTTIDIDLNTNIEVNGEKKSIEIFSAGYKDLVGICTRLALIDSIFEDEKPFLILDDPFVNLDEEKIEKAISLIKAISKTYQVIYFTCHESRV
ncbi:MAG: AAA family ATPase [Clostridia bacterium]|nr:AAA family ATPase [Clostridia bacterium]